MSEIKQINTGVAELLAVKVPEVAREFKVFNDERPYLSFFNGILTPRIYLPPGNWTPLGIDTELTEEQCVEVVESYETIFTDYNNRTTKYFRTAKEAFASLMQANWCYSVNPYGEMPVNKDFYWGYLADLKQWHEAEANTGPRLILKKENGS